MKDTTGIENRWIEKYNDKCLEVDQLRNKLDLAEKILKRVSCAYEGLDDIYDASRQARTYFQIEEE